MECELCGKHADLIKAEVEGTILSVCQSCEKLGRRLEYSVELRDKPQHSMDTLLIDPDFAKIIRKSRENAGLTIEKLGEKISEKTMVLERIEHGMRPTDTLAKKLEKALGVKLLGYLEANIELHSNKTSSTSIGDVAVIKKRK